MNNKNRFNMLHPQVRLVVAVVSIVLLSLALFVSAHAERPPSDEKNITDQANIVLLRASAGKSEQLGKALRELLAHSRSEPGCAVIELNQSADDPNLWMVYERWRGKEALASHMKQPYVAAFLKQLAQLSSEPADVRSFEHRP
jgi:quinol monooxygenase YgiN